MRITNKMMTANSQNNINRNKVLVDKLTTQNTTHKKISRPSDDPVVAIRALRLRSNLSDIDQFVEKNVKDAEAWLNITAGALEATKKAATGISAQYSKGASDELRAEDRNQILKELKALRDQIYSNGDADYAGRNIFTGYRTSTSLMFKESENIHYRITEQFTGGDVGRIEYVKGRTTDLEAAMNAAATPDLTNVELTSVSRIRLSYDKLGAGAPTVTYVDSAGDPQTLTVTVKSIANAANTDAAYNPGADEAFYIPETGELVFGSDVRDDLETAKSISVAYDKTNWDKGDLRPEHYFDCVSNPGTADQITYSDHEQKIEYDVSFNQKLQINTNANEAFTHDIGRNMDEMINAIEAAIDIEENADKLEKMKSDPRYASTADQAKIAKLIEANEKEQTLYKEKIHNMFASGITSSEAYFNKVNLAATNVGNRGNRLDMVKNRLEEQQISFEDLADSNEGVEVTDAFINLTAANFVYNSSLMATGKISQSSLLDYI